MSGDVFCEVLAGLDPRAGINRSLCSGDQMREPEYAGMNKGMSRGMGSAERAQKGHIL